MAAVPVDGLTVGDALRRAARQPEREALVFPERGYRLTYGEYDRRTDDVARSLLAMGVRKGDHVALWATNQPEWPLIFFAAARIGAVLVTVNPAYGARELEHCLAESCAKVLFLHDRFRSSDHYGTIVEVCPELAGAETGALRAARCPALRWVVGLTERPPRGVMAWSEFMMSGDVTRPGEVDERARQLEPDEPVNLQYTSGTTGHPEGVLLSHRNVLLNAWYVGEAQGIDADDRVCVPVPFYQCFGLVIGLLGSLVRGATTLVPSQCFEAGAVLDCVERERATSIYGAPAMFVALLGHEAFAHRDLTSLRTGIMAGSPCPGAVMRRVIEDMGVRGMSVAYGLTEALPAVTQSHAGDPLAVRLEAVGKPLAGVEARRRSGYRTRSPGR